MRSPGIRLLLGVGAVTTLASPLLAQTAAKPATSPASANAPQPPVSAEPATTSATYGDWVMRCQRVGEGATARKVCEVAQAIRVQEGRDPVAEVALGRLPLEKTLHVTTLLPPNVSFPSTVSVGGDRAGSALDLQWHRCVPGGCFADGAVGDDTVKQWRAQTNAGKLSFKDAGGRDIALPFSFRGLAQALDALDKA